MTRRLARMAAVLALAVGVAAVPARSEPTGSAEQISDVGPTRRAAPTSSTTWFATTS